MGFSAVNVDMNIKGETRTKMCKMLLHKVLCLFNLKNNMWQRDKAEFLMERNRLLLMLFLRAPVLILNLFFKRFRCFIPKGLRFNLISIQILNFRIFKYHFKAKNYDLTEFRSSRWNGRSAIPLKSDDSLQKIDIRVLGINIIEHIFPLKGQAPFFPSELFIAINPISLEMHT